MADIAIMTESRREAPNDVLRQGLIAGAIGGGVFLLGQLLTGALTTGDLFAAPRLFASLILQQLPAAVHLESAVILGLGMPLVLAALFGLGVALVAANVPLFRESPMATVLLGTVAGFVLWPLNFYWLAPVLHAPWFGTDTDRAWQFVCHTFLFGTVLGLYLARKFAWRGVLR